jgi:lysophospholipase L1-like esterase
MKWKFPAVLAAATALTATALTALAVPLGATAASATSGHYYLALGDSLSVGWQPNANGVGRATDQGYVNDIFAAKQVEDPTLQLVNLGCPGETTSSFMNGGVCATPYRSQLSAAVKFLKKYGAQTSFVTIDIGANNVDNCLTGGTIDLTCVGNGITAMQQQLPKILNALQAADPTVQIYGMNYYDPFLAVYLQGQTSEASQSETLTQVFNADEAKIYGNHKHHAPVADVASAFLTYDNTTNNGDMIGGNLVPDNVFEICALTYMCAPAPVGPNIHANADGYQVIADQFLPLIP